MKTKKQTEIKNWLQKNNSKANIFDKIFHIEEYCVEELIRRANKNVKLRITFWK